MNHYQEKLLILLRRKSQQNLSEEEKEEMDLLLEQLSDEAVYECLDLLYEKEPSADIISETVDWNSMFLGIVQHKPLSLEPERRPKRYLPYMLAASLIILVCVVIFNYKVPNREQNYASKGLPDIELPAGGNRAILMLGDGTRIQLNSHAAGAIAFQGQTKIESHAGGVLVYRALGNDTRNLTINQVETPNGGEYTVVLPDGSRARLNAASSIRFPAFFGDSLRSVSITGEVYFDIAENRKTPFMVSVNGQTKIKVLGTKFNVNAYSNEQVLTTSLVQGSIALQDSEGAVVMHPGQQALIHRGNKGRERITIVNKDLSEALSWTNGLFQFERTELRAVAIQLSRWYNVVIEVDGSPEKCFVTGFMSRTDNLPQVLKQLCFVSGLNYKIEAGKVKLFASK